MKGFILCKGWGGGGNNNFGKKIMEKVQTCPVFASTVCFVCSMLGRSVLSDLP